ncbi:MAG: hypothetical protein GY830_04510 [Bacteroidetes bacterium]|nr:hypothetical protein [Bacteroidota bacterium]
MSQNEIYENADQKLKELLSIAKNLFKKNNKIIIPKPLSSEELKNLNIIIETCEQRKAVLTVLITLLSYKIIVPQQDIRNHQSNMQGGFSGRTYDTNIITPFMKKNGFPAMVESGWLTRSLEQNRPYNLNFPGKITPTKTKSAFLEILNFIEEKKKSPNDYLIYLFQKLMIYKKEHQIDLIIQPLLDKKISIQVIVKILTEHFESCSEVGKSRLPVLAIYSLYKLIIKELNRYKDKELQILQSHTSADARSGEIGDINILDSKKIPFEAVEVKYEKQITAQMISDAYEKLKIYPVERYYLLSTKLSDESELEKINKVIAYISKEHGCQIIVNGIIPTIKYYLRLLNNTNKFIEKYAYYVEIDNVIKLEHKKIWNKIICSISN